MELARVPEGQFVMGGATGSADERTRGTITITRPFWMGTCEVSNEQFRRFDPAHDSGSEPMLWLKWHPGHYASLNEPRQPVCRVSWEEASAYCRWLSQTTGRRFALPSEPQWEWACRAGTDAPWSFGTGVSAGFTAFANLADSSLLDLGRLAAMEKVKPFFDVEPADDRHPVSAAVGSFQPNPWGLHDMHGNVAEWTASTELPYPFHADDPRHATPDLRKVVRGGSWHDRADQARSGSRTGYWPWQRVFNVGFRVVCETDGS